MSHLSTASPIDHAIFNDKPLTTPTRQSQYRPGLPASFFLDSPLPSFPSLHNRTCIWQQTISTVATSFHIIIRGIAWLSYWRMDFIQEHSGRPDWFKQPIPTSALFYRTRYPRQSFFLATGGPRGTLRASRCALL